MDIRENNWLAITLSLLGFLSSILGFAIIIWIVDKQTPEVSLPILLVTSIVALLAALSSMVAVFNSLRLTNPEYALGLPEGTVRAVIALSLILIFMTTSTFLSGQLKGPTMVSKNFPLEQLENFKDRVVSIETRMENNQKVYDVQLLGEINAASIDFAKQILTTIGTLVVAVAGFYFGSKASGNAQVEHFPLLPFISSIDPEEGKQGETISITIYGRDFYAPREIKLIRGKQEIIAPPKNMTWSATLIRCTFAIPHDAQTDAWDVIVVNESGREARGNDAFTVLPARVNNLEQKSIESN
jgi:hypothetical protein